MNITGWFDVGDARQYTGGAFTAHTYATSYNQYESGGASNTYVDFDAKKSWTGETSTAGNHTHTVSLSGGSHTHTTNNTGGGLPLNIMPPYTTVYAWRRTA